MKKILVAVSMAALLFASCSTNVAANDTVDSAEVTAVASEAGVVVLSWEAVPNASSYTVTKKVPGTEAFQNVSSRVQSSNGRCYLVEAVEEKDADYTFKVVTETEKINGWDAVTEVSVKTPEEFKEVAFDASKITFEKVPYTANNYNIKFPVDAGYTYSIKAVTANVDAKVAYGSTAYSSWNYNGAKYIKQTKEVTENDETKEVEVPATVVANATVSGTLPVYVVVKATPVNAAVAKPVYAISTASVTAANTYGQATNVSVTKETSKKARVTFDAPKVGKEFADAAKYAIYRSDVTFDAAIGDNVTTSALKKLGTAKMSKTLNSDAEVKYYYDDEIEAYEGQKAGKVASYNYYVVYEGDDVSESVWSDVVTLNNEATGSDTATNVAPVNNGISITGSAATITTQVANVYGTNQMVITVKVPKGSKPTVKYKAFATKAEALAALADDLTDDQTGTKVVESANVPMTWVTDGISSDGVLTSDTYTATVTLDPGKTVTTTTNVPATGDNTTTVVTSNSGKWYVYRVTAVASDGSTVVDTMNKVLTQTSETTITAGVPGTTTTSYSIDSFQF